MTFMVGWHIPFLSIPRKNDTFIKNNRIKGKWFIVLVDMANWKTFKKRITVTMIRHCLTNKV